MLQDQWARYFLCLSSNNGLRYLTSSTENKHLSRNSLLQFLSHMFTQQQHHCLEDRPGVRKRWVLHMCWLQTVKGEKQMWASCWSSVYNSRSNSCMIMMTYMYIHLHLYYHSMLQHTSCMTMMTHILTHTHTPATIGSITPATWISSCM